MAPRQRVFTPDLIDDLYGRIHALEERIRLLHRTPSVIERINPVTLPDPVEGQIAVDSRSNCLIYYADGAWREKCSAVHAIKVYADKTTNQVANGAFRFTIEDDLADTEISEVRAFNGTTGSGNTVVQISNQTRGFDILSTRLTIPGGALVDNSTAVIDTGGNPADANNVVHLDDMIWIDVDSIGTGSKGLGVYITFHGPRVNLEP